MEYTPSTQQSPVFNMHEAYAKRINELLTLCIQHYMNDDPIRWYKALISLHTEINPLLNENEKAELYVLIKTLTKEKRVLLPNLNNYDKTPYLKLEMALRTILHKHELLLGSKKTERPTT